MSKDTESVVQEVVNSMRDRTKTAEGKPRRTMRFLSVGFLQSPPVNCKNREEDGSVKTAVFGGTDRLRSSSQSCVRVFKDNAVSCDMADDFGLLSTRELGLVLKPHLKALGASPANVEQWAKEFEVVAFEGKALSKRKKKAKEQQEARDDDAEAENKEAPEIKSKKDQRSMLWPSNAQLFALARYIVDGGGLIRDRELAVVRAEVGLIMEQDGCPDGAFLRRLCGAMSAIVDGLTTDATLLVAHSISTEEASPSTDYFVAVDRMAQTKGAVHIGAHSFGSATMFYTFALDVGSTFQGSTLDKEHQCQILSRSIELLLGATPTGKRAKMWADVETSYAIATSWDSHPLSMAVAFERPARAENGKTPSENSWVALLEHARKMEVSYASTRGVRVVGCFEFGKNDLREFCDKVAREFIL